MSFKGGVGIAREDIPPKDSMVRRPLDSPIVVLRCELRMDTKALNLDCLRVIFDVTETNLLKKSAAICCQPFSEMAHCSISYPMMFASVHCISFVLYMKCNLCSLQKVSYALETPSLTLSHK